MKPQRSCCCCYNESTVTQIRIQYSLTMWETAAAPSVSTMAALIRPHCSVDVKIRCQVHVQSSNTFFFVLKSWIL